MVRAKSDERSSLLSSRFRQKLAMWSEDTGSNQTWKAFFLVAWFLGMSQISTPAAAETAWCNHLKDVSPADAAHIGRLAGAVASDSPHPLPFIKLEGALPGQGAHDASSEAMRDVGKARTLAYGWSVTGKTAYLRSAVDYIVAWAQVYKPSGNPIDETNFVQLFEAYSIVKREIESAQQAIVDRWISKFRDVYLQRLRDQSRSALPQHNNWQSHRIKIATAVAVVLNDNQALAEVEAYFHAQVKASIMDDGSVVDFHERDSIKYAVYSLQALTDASMMAVGSGHDWFGSNGDSKRLMVKAVHWLDPYILGKESHVEFMHSKEKFDRIRGEAGVKDFGNAPWNAAGASDLYWTASFLDAGIRVMASRLTGHPPLYLAACRGLQ